MQLLRPHHENEPVDRLPFPHHQVTLNHMPNATLPHLYSFDNRRCAQSKRDAAFGCCMNPGFNAYPGLCVRRPLYISIVRPICSSITSANLYAPRIERSNMYFVANCMDVIRLQNMRRGSSAVIHNHRRLGGMVCPCLKTPANVPQNGHRELIPVTLLCAYFSFFPFAFCIWRRCASQYTRCAADTRDGY